MVAELNRTEARLFSKICKSTVLAIGKEGKRSRFKYDNLGQSKNMYKEEIADDINSLESLVHYKLIERETIRGWSYFCLTDAGFALMLENKK